MNQTHNISADGSDTLVVFVHAYSLKAANLKSLEEAVLKVWPEAASFRPDLPFSLVSLKDANHIVEEYLLKKIDQKMERAEAEGRPFKKIILIGHSLGALLARKLYVVACGETSQAPFEDIYRIDPSTPVSPITWAAKVERIVLLAGMNRGWRISHHLNLKNAMLWTIGSGICHFLRLFSRHLPLIFTIRRGAEFITQLRIQWIRMRQRAGKPQDPEDADSLPFSGDALTVQLLGSIDDMVAPQDNVDLVSGGILSFLTFPTLGIQT